MTHAEDDKSRIRLRFFGGGVGLRLSKKITKGSFNVILLTLAAPIHCLDFKGYSSDQSHFSEINVKLAEKNKYATHSVQRSLETCENS